MFSDKFFQSLLQLPMILSITIELNDIFLQSLEFFKIDLEYNSPCLHVFVRVISLKKASLQNWQLLPLSILFSVKL